jgi:hypothetical protein
MVEEKTQRPRIEYLQSFHDLLIHYRDNLASQSTPKCREADAMEEERRAIQGYEHIEARPDWDSRTFRSLRGMS